MARIEIREFAEEHLDAAGALLAERHRRHRRAEPLLSPRYEEPAAARAEVEALWRSDGASGAVGLRDGRVIGYVLGVRKSEATWGPNVWVEAAGHAVAEAEDVRDIYASAAARWTEEGRTRQYAVVPASDEALVDAWFRLGFGQQHTHGVRELPDARWPVDGVREATEQDVEALVELGPVLDDHQLRAPVFSGLPRSYDDDELRKEIVEDLAADDAGTLVAEADGRIVASFFLVPVEKSTTNAGLIRPDGASFLAWAATFPEARGAGAGVALTEASFAWARARGYETMATDWRATNLLSSRFWPRRGFRTTFLRLYRSIP